MPKKFTRRKFFFVWAVFFAAVCLHYFGALGYLEKMIRAPLLPLGASARQINISIVSRLGSFFNKNSAAPADCSTDRQKLELAQAQAKLFQQENDELKNQLQFKTKFKGTMITASVIGKNSDNFENMIVIDAGSNSGLVSGKPVIVSDGVLIGVVAKVDPDISLVRLINDNNSKIAATVLNHDKSLGVVEGGYGLSVRMNYIPRDEEIVVGDQIVTSGLDGDIPRGLLIGQVAVAENEAYQPFQQAVLVTSANLDKLSLVSVITQ